MAASRGTQEFDRPTRTAESAEVHQPSRESNTEAVQRSGATLWQFASSFGFSAAGSALSGRGASERSAGGRGVRSTVWTVLGGLLLPALLLLVWQLLSSTGAIPAYRLPSPAAVVAAGFDLGARGELGLHIAISTQRVLIGFVLGSLVGLVVAAVVGLSRVGSILLSPTLGALRAVPSLAWLPLLVLYLGFNEDQKVSLIAIGAFFPVYTTVSAALRHVDPQLVEAGRAYGYSGPALLRVVQLPAVVPSVVSALRLALAQSWLFLVAGELLGSSFGLGFLLNDSQNNGRIDRLFLAIVLLAVLGKITDGLIGLLERYLLKRWA